jgi:hypothetical protein
LVNRYWNKELSHLWFVMSVAENMFLKCNDQSMRRGLREEFKVSTYL